LSFTASAFAATVWLVGAQVALATENGPENSSVDLVREIIEHETVRNPRSTGAAAAPAAAATATPADSPTPAATAADGQSAIAPISWPPGLEPRSAAISPTPLATDKLPTADFLVITWTYDETNTLAHLFTPGVNLNQWYMYSRNWSSFAPLFWQKSGPATGTTTLSGAPNRHYHTLGSYYITRIGSHKVLCFRSNLHVQTDGPKMPVIKLCKQLIAEVQPHTIITTGTGGAIGKEIKLGDVVVAGSARFKFVNYTKLSYANKTYACTKYGASVFTKLSDKMLAANAGKLAPLSNGLPAIYYPGSKIANPAVVTTDAFLWDDVANSFGLQEMGNMVEMDAAAVGEAISEAHSRARWVSVRNASDPQMNCAGLDSYKLSCDGKTCQDIARCIYEQYGQFTTVSSVLATWAIIAAGK
jgi:nucleoside phosphorylase